MKRLTVVLTAVGLLLMPLFAIAHAAESPSKPPIGQPLVREGDLAVELAKALNLSTTTDEAKAESVLSEAGVLPANGWIADYPVTPDILAELQDSVKNAAESGKIGMDKEVAIEKVKDVSTELGLPITVAGEQFDYGPDKIPPQDYASQGPPPEDWSYDRYAEAEGYYSDYGPPVVSYYPPPWEYSYLYSYVPHPFWWGAAAFGGFFVLNDFNRVVVVNKHIKRVTNQVVNRRGGVVNRVNAANRRLALNRGNLNRGNALRQNALGRNAQRGTTGLRTAQDRQRARAILNRNLAQSRQGTALARDTARSGNSRLAGRANRNAIAGGANRNALAGATPRVGRAQTGERRLSGAGGGRIPPGRDSNIGARGGVNRFAAVNPGLSGRGSSGGFSAPRSSRAVPQQRFAPQSRFGASGRSGSPGISGGGRSTFGAVQSRPSMRSGGGFSAPRSFSGGGARSFSGGGRSFGGGGGAFRGGGSSFGGGGFRAGGGGFRGGGGGFRGGGGGGRAGGGGGRGGGRRG